MNLRRNMAQMRAALMRVPVPPSRMEAAFMAAAEGCGELAPDAEMAFMRALHAAAAGHVRLSPAASRLFLRGLMVHLDRYLPDPNRSLVERINIKPADVSTEVIAKLQAALAVADARQAGERQ